METKLKAEQIARVKGMGFLINRGTDRFSGRVVPEGSVFTAEQLEAIARIAHVCGSGKVAFSARLCAEIVGIPYERIDEAVALAEQAGLRFGGTGAKVRPVTACKGTTCVYGNYDTQALAAAIHRAYYLGWDTVSLPHKFKIAVGGCPNSCMKPSLNDFGVEGHRAPSYDPAACKACKTCQVVQRCTVGAAAVGADGKLAISDACIRCGVCTGKCPFRAVAWESPVQYRLYVGGTWGKQTRMGTALPGLYEERDIFPMLEKTMLWFRENAFVHERLGACIDRLGADRMLAELSGDGLLARRDAILAAPLRQRP